MIGPVSSTSKDALLLDASGSSIGAAKIGSGQEFGERLQQSLDRHQSQKVAKNQSQVPVSNARKSAGDSVPAASKTESGSAQQTHEQKQPSIQSTHAETSPVAPEANAEGIEEELPPGKGLPLAESIQAAMAQFGIDSQAADLTADGHLGTVIRQVTAEQRPQSAAPAPLAETESDGLLTDELDITTELLNVNPLGNPLSQSQASITAAALVAEQAGVRSATKNTESVAGLTTASIASAVAEAVKGTNTSNTQSLPHMQGLVNQLSPAAGVSQAPNGHATQGLLTALDKMPETTAQKMEGVSPFSALVNGATEAADDTQPLMRLDRPLTHVRWAQDLGERVQWMVNRSMNGAEIRLNPPQLGPIEVRIQMQQEQANVAFTAQHANVRDAIEAAIPRLREMLGQQSLNLVNVDISQHSFADQRHQGRTGSESSTRLSDRGLVDAELMDAPMDTPLPVYNGLINTYA